MIVEPASAPTCPSHSLCLLQGMSGASRPAVVLSALRLWNIDESGSASIHLVGWPCRRTATCPGFEDIILHLVRATLVTVSRPPVRLVVSTWLIRSAAMPGA